MNEPRRRRLGVLILLGSLSAFGPLTIDTYLPALPRIATDLGSDAIHVQLTLIVFVAVLALSQLGYGAVSDGLGRRRPLIFGLGVFVVGSVLCAVAPNVGILIAARAVQAAGAAAATVLSRTIVRDMYRGTEMTRYFSSLMLVTGAAPVLAPFLGAQLLRFASWRSVFVVLAAIGAVLLVAVLAFLAESLPPERRSSTAFARQSQTYRYLLRDRHYLRSVVATSLMFAAMFAYIAGSSFVLQGSFGLSAQEFSVVFGLNGLGLVLLGQANGRLVGVLADERILMRASLALGAAGSAGVLLCAVTNMPLGFLLFCLFSVVSSVGPVLANGTSLALADHGDRAGAASSMQGLIQFAVGGCAATSMGAAGRGIGPMAITMSVCAFAALAVSMVGASADN